MEGKRCNYVITKIERKIEIARESQRHTRETERGRVEIEREGDRDKEIEGGTMKEMWEINRK